MSVCRPCRDLPCVVPDDLVIPAFTVPPAAQPAVYPVLSAAMTAICPCGGPTYTTPAGAFSLLVFKPSDIAQAQAQVNAWAYLAALQHLGCVTPVTAAYWSFDHAGDPLAGLEFRDEVNLIPLVFNPGGLSVVAPGIIGNGFKLDSRFGIANTGLKSEFGFDPATDSGITMWGWLNMQNALTPAESFIFILQFDDSTALYLQPWTYATLYNGENPSFISVNTADVAAVGVWFFWCITWNNLTGTLKLYVNGNPPVIGAGNPALANPKAQGKFFVQLTTLTTKAIVLDEIGLALSGPITDLQVTDLYNAGAGRTWPYAGFLCAPVPPIPPAGILDEGGLPILGEGGEAILPE